MKRASMGVAALALAVAWIAAYRAGAQAAVATARAAQVAGVDVGEVLVHGRTALRILAMAGGLMPLQRAERVAARLNELHAERPLAGAELTLRAVGERLVAVTARDRVVVTATPDDAAGINLTVWQTAKLWMLNLADALEGRPVPEEAVRGHRQELGGTAPVVAPAAASPALGRKIVPILTFGSNLNIGVAQVQGAEADVRRVRAVAQLETDYRDVARIRILVPVQTENVISRIDRVPGVAVRAIVDFALRR